MAILVNGSNAILIDGLGNVLTDEFGTLDSFTLALTQTNGGTIVTVPEAGIYAQGTPFVLTATPSPTYSFIFWSLNGQRFHANSLAISINQDLTVEGYFALTTPPTPTSSPMGGARCPFCKGGDRCPVCGGSGWVR